MLQSNCSADDGAGGVLHLLLACDWCIRKSVFKIITE